MRKDNISYTFRILDEVSKDGEVTQRSLSQRLGVALGLTNLYMKRLCKKGFIKVINLKPNRLRYELTPIGITQKTALAFKYVQDSYVFYREARRNLTKIFAASKASGAKSVVLYGTGEIAEIALLSLQEVELDLLGVVSPQHVGQVLCGKPVLSPKAIMTMSYDRVVVVEQDQEEAKKLLVDLGVEESKILWVGQ